MYRRDWLIAVLIVTAFTRVAWTQNPSSEPGLLEELTVWASKTETPLDQFGNRVTVITAEDIQRHQWRTVSEVLHILPGVSHVSNGPDGGLTTLFARGANSQDTLVLLNGVKLNDPSGVARGYDFAHLSTAGIERIELILGPQTTLYGSDASSGVVNIVMTQGAEPQYHLNLEASDEDSIRAGAGLSGTVGRLRYAAAVERSQSDAISARNDRTPEDPSDTLDIDEYNNTNGYLLLNWDLAQSGVLELGMQLTDADGDLDASNGDDPNATNTFRQSVLHAKYAFTPGDGNWRPSLHLNRAQTDRTNDDQVDVSHPLDSLVSDFEGTQWGFEFRNVFEISNQARLVTGLTYDKEEGSGDTVGSSAFGPFSSTFDEQAEIAGLYAQARFSWENGFHATIGGRYDDHDTFGDSTTYQVAAGYRASSGTHVRGFYGTSFKAPSIFQIYSPFGNRALTEETGKSWELALTQDFLKETFQFGVLVFGNDYEDLIDFGFNADTGGFTYLNLTDQNQTDGYELFGRYTGKLVQARFSFESLDAERDTVSFDGTPLQVPLIRRLDDKASLLISGIHGAWRWSLDALHYGEASDTDFTTFETRPLDAYTLLNIGGDYTFKEQFTLGVKVRNLTDEDYTQIIGYNTHGRRIFLNAVYRY